MSLTRGNLPCLLHQLKHNKLLHEKVVLLSILSSNVPSSRKDRVKVEYLGQDFIAWWPQWVISKTTVPEILKMAGVYGLSFNENENRPTSGRVTVFATGIQDVSLAEGTFRVPDEKSGSPAAISVCPQPGRELAPKIQL